MDKKGSYVLEFSEISFTLLYKSKLNVEVIMNETLDVY